ncbi:MAG: hypothetical protein DHS20C10_10930 [marine bacterium B5-7]|nr:MAG: hypothetical protein DHS20C10_10930 [marine bacterium B5-7]
MTNITSKKPLSRFLAGQTAVEAKVSDHNIVIQGDALFFNMMMQARWNKEKSRYNNGFGRVENQADYQARIHIIVQLLAETLHMNPHISILGLA